MKSERGPKKVVIGTVVSDRMQKTITVREERLVKHAVYGKYVRRATTYQAHDERGEAREGDQVEILRTRPLSKTKHWRLVRIVRRGVGRPVELMDELATPASAAPVAPEDGATPAPAAEAAVAPPAPAAGDEGTAPASSEGATT
jgi:small subunit ribosomal protein S17